MKKKKSMIALGDEQLKILDITQDPKNHEDFINKFTENGKEIIEHLIKTPFIEMPFYLRISYLETTDGVYHMTKCEFSPPN